MTVYTQGPESLAKLKFQKAQAKQAKLDAHKKYSASQKQNTVGLGKTLKKIGKKATKVVKKVVKVQKALTPIAQAVASGGVSGLVQYGLNKAAASSSKAGKYKGAYDAKNQAAADQLGYTSAPEGNYPEAIGPQAPKSGLASIPTWAWIGAGVVAAMVLFSSRRRD